MSKQMKTRCVHIFPGFENNDAIETVREKYDNLHRLIEPHITLAFPFESELSADDVQRAVKDAIKDLKPLKIAAEGFEAVESHGFYLFLNIVEGQSALKALHYKLHEGILHPYQSPWTKDGSYKPHITVGRFKSYGEMEKAYNDVIKMFENLSKTFENTVDRMIVEVIGENDESIIESIVTFGENE